MSVLTVAPGDAVYSLWGHSALRVMDPESGLDVVFNWGTFDITRPWFIPRFAYGDMLYEVSIEPMPRFLRGADFEQRDVIEQSLALTEVQRNEIWVLLEENLLPENRAYQYDFVRDNCSTRILDLLVTTEAIRLGPDVGDRTYRQLVDGFSHHHGWLDLGIDLAFGSPLDDVPTERERAFLPLELFDVLENAEAANGGAIISQTRTLLDATKEQGTGGIPFSSIVLWLLGSSLLVVTLMQFRSYGFEAGLLDRLILGLFGFVGLFLLVMWFFTLHWVTSANWDILWALPTHLIVAIVWRRFSYLKTYFKWTGVLTLMALLLQLTLIQPIPPAMAVLVGAFGLRLWLLGTPSQRSSKKSSG